MSPRVRLEPLGRFPGLRVLTWHGGDLYAGCGYHLLRWRSGEGDWQPFASFEASGWRRLSSAHRLSARLFRDGYHALVVLPDGNLVVALPGIIGRLPAGTGRVEASFRVPRGTRPLALAATASGYVFWGEYFDNPRRDAVHLYGSADSGRSWQIVHTFPPGSIRHVHSITYDPYGECLWVLTGDEGRECRILRAAQDWSTVTTVIAGDQQARAVSLVPLPEAVYFATDTPMEQNFIYRLRREGHLERLAPIACSSFWSCRVGRVVFFSTTVEPSEVNRDVCSTLYGSADMEHWAACLRWQRDAWPSRFFQYPTILLPSGDNPTDLLAATGLAVREEDQVTHLWRVMSE